MVQRTNYRDQTEIGLFLKNIFGLPLLNKEVVEKCFFADFMSINLDIYKYNAGTSKTQRIYGII